MKVKQMIVQRKSSSYNIANLEKKAKIDIVET